MEQNNSSDDSTASQQLDTLFRDEDSDSDGNYQPTSGEDTESESDMEYHPKKNIKITKKNINISTDLTSSEERFIKSLGGMPIKGNRHAVDISKMNLGKAVHSFCELKKIEINKIILTRKHFEQIVMIYGEGGKGMIIYIPQVAERYWRQWFVNPHGLAGIHNSWMYLNKIEKIACEFCNKKNHQDTAEDQIKNLLNIESDQTQNEDIVQNDILPVQDPRVKCPIEGCPSQFLEERYLKDHGKLSHAQSDQAIFNIAIKTSCPLCNREVKSISQHKRNCPARDSNKVECPYCSEIMMRANLNKHIKLARCSAIKK